MNEPSLQRPAERLIDRLYGGLVPVGAAARAHLWHRSRPVACEGSVLENWRVKVGDPPWVAWTIQLLRPDGGALAPVLLTGDACWGPPEDGVKARCAAAGVALAWFNRVELAADPPDGSRWGPVFERFSGARFGALSAWAWGYGRAVDALRQVPGLDGTRIGIVGHSRGGKAALLAAATDPRIALTVAHNSGAAGAASSHRLGPGAESLQALATAFPHWLATDFMATLHAGGLEGLDQDALLSCMAPRRLCLIQARGDAWANPEGVQWVVQRAEQAWRRTRAYDDLELAWREGGHPMGLKDWDVALGAMHRTTEPVADPPQPQAVASSA